MLCLDWIWADKSTGAIFDDDKEKDEGSAKIADIDIKSLRPVYQEGDFLLFMYDGDYFPGQVMTITEESVMIKSLKNWKWPPKEDILYSIDIIQKIKPQKFTVYGKFTR